VAENQYLTPAQRALQEGNRDAMQRRVQVEYNSLTPDKLLNFNSIGNKYPNLSKDLVMAMVSSGLNADTPGIDKIVSYDGIAQLKRDARNVKDIKSSVEKDRGFFGSVQNAVKNVTWDPLKGATRVGFAGLRSLYDYATVLTRDVTQGVPLEQLRKDFQQSIFGESTQLGQLVRNWSSQGDGFFITPESKVGKAQAKAMAQYGKINGESFTIGRYTAKSLGQGPDTTGYKILSGLVDATLNIALDPSMYVGAGAATKVLGGGRKFAAAKGELAAAGLVDDPIKSITEFAEAEAKRLQGIRTRSANKFKKEEMQYLTDTAHIVETEAKAAKKMLALEKESFFLYGADEVAKETLSEASLANWLVTHPKASTGELLNGVDNLSATHNNTGKVFLGTFITDELPAAGRVTVGVNQLDEYFVTGAKDVKWKVLDITDDYADASQKAKSLEEKRRAALMARIEERSADFSKSPVVRQGYDDLVKIINDEGKSLEGFLFDGLMTGKMQPMVALLTKVAATKNPELMWNIIDDITEIWKVDGFANIRAMYGEMGGFALREIDGKLAARAGQVGNALAEIVEPTNLGPNMLKMLESLEEPTARIAKTEQKLAKAEKAAADHKRVTKELDLWRQFVDNDPELLEKIVNDPNYQGLGKFLNMKAGPEGSLIEFARAQVGLTERFGGELASTFNGSLKYMLGRNFQKIAEVIADETDIVKIRDYFGKKLDIDMVKNLADAKTADEVMAVFLKELNASTSDPQIFRSLALRGRAAELSASPLAKLVEPINPYVFKFAEATSRSYNRYFVRAKSYNLGDKTALVDGVENWLSSTRLASVIGKGKQEELIATAITKIANSTSNQERAAIVEKMNTDFAQAIIDRLGLKPDEAETLINKIKVSGRDKNAKTVYSVNQIAENTVPTMINAADEVVVLDGGMHEFQLLNDFISLPDTVEIQRAVNKFELANKRFSGKYRAEQGRILVEELGEMWRTAQLAFRMGYIIRNVAEMQMRQFLTGHANIFSHPLQFTAMVLGDANGNAFQKLMSRMSRNQYDLAGNAFKNAEAEGEFLEGVREYQKLAHRKVSTSDYRNSAQSEVFKYYRVVSPEHPDFFKGLAFTINRFASDKLNPEIARLIVNNAPENAKRDFIAKLISEYDKPNNIIREYTTGAFAKNPGLKAMFVKNVELDTTVDNLSPDNIYRFFFDEAQEHSLASQILAVAGAGPKSNNVLELIMNGVTRVTDENGKEIVLRTPWASDIKTVRELDVLEKEFMKKLETAFKPEDLKDARVLSERAQQATFADGGILKKYVDGFFEFSARVESKFNFGPEYQMSYWDYVGRYARILSTEDLKYVQRQAQKTLSPIRLGNKAIGKKHPTLRVVETELKKRLKNPDYANGMESSWTAVHQMAAREAANYTKNLFYDAAKQRQWANAWRIVFPFAQAQANTIATWGKLISGTKKPAYKFGKAYQAALQPGSNTIYDISDMTYDENQGFIYKDQATGEERFKMPLVGNLLGALTGDMDMKGVQISAPVQSLNLAFGQVNPLVPGIGPAGQLAFTALGKQDTFGAAYEVMRDIVSPYGEPQRIEDIVFPSWLKKTVAYTLGDKTSVQRNMKDWAAYLASTGEYGENPFASDRERTRLFEDAQGMSRWMGVFTALFQSISPATPSTEVVTKIKDDNNKVKFMTMTMLYDAWNKISEANPGNYGKAVTEFAETFGAKNLMVAIGGTTTAVRGTDDAWNFLNNNPDAASQFARNPGDVVPYFFPGGNYSLKYYNWQKSTGARRPLSVAELENEAEGLVYAMLKDQIEEQQIAGGYTEYWYNSKIAELDEQFNGRPSDFVQTNTADEKLGRIADALENPAFQQSPIFKETSEFYNQFVEFKKELNRMKVTNYAELKGSSGYATMARNELISLAESLMANNPAFARMYYGVFASQLEG
jgi:hypothetical protein